MTDQRKSIPKFLLIFIPFLFITSCKYDDHNGFRQELLQKEEITKTLRNSNDIEALTALLAEYEKENNKTGEMLARKELGKRYRESSLFKEAIEQHEKALNMATFAEDTLEIIQILNQLGTNFRRIGALDKGAEYHYHALNYCELYSDTVSNTAEKNRVVSLNGIGNTHLSLNNLEVAESAFRKALIGERKLKSYLGQAINYANIGSIKEIRRETDSAYLYYQLSMDYNRKAKSDVGIALCHNHLGRLAENKGEWNKAIEEYRHGYDMMIGNKDRWHWLEACINLARVSIKKNNLTEANKFLKEGVKTAQEINSHEHLAQCFKLKSEYEEKRGNIALSLTDYKRGMAYQDSVINDKSQNIVENLRINYERERKQKEVNYIRQAYESEQYLKRNILYSSAAILIAAGITIGILVYALRTKSRSQQLMKKMEQTRQEFFTNVTHEFKTPLTVVLGIGKQIEDNRLEDPAALKSAGAMIVRQGNNLLQLINQLLDISKVKSAIGTPHWRSGNIIAYLNMTIESYRELARAKHIDLIYVYSQTNIQMDFVPDYMHKILRNLLSNAIKFTPEYGKITVTALQKDDTFILHIADTGQGIAKEDLPHIFEAFYRARRYHEQNIGTGIGLSLVYQIINVMKGTIHVSSTEGKGSTFTVKLPMKQGKHTLTSYDEWEMADEKNIPTDEGEELQEKKEVNNSASRILIIEDNADISYYIGSLLKDNYQLHYARNGEEGFEKASELVPELIVTDLMMPEKSGYELCQDIRATEVLNHIPIIVITAKSTEEDRIKAIEVGADAYLYKPFNPEELHIRINKLLEQRRLLREKYSKAVRNGTEKEVQLSKYDRNFMNKFINLIYVQMPKGELDAETIAAKMCMSRSQLNRKLMTISGQNTTAYILQTRINEAKRLLLSDVDLTIGEVSAQCGFDDVSYFSRVFKQFCEMTPSQYRKK